MFNNVGGKIKTVAKVFFWILFAASAATGIILLTQWGTVTKLIGAGTIIVGFFMSWISSLFLCGFGQLIESVEELARNSSKSAADSTNSQTLKKWREQGLISEEEYQQRIRQ